MGTFFDYLKCVYANKPTLLGYTSLFICGGLTYLYLRDIVQNSWLLNVATSASLFTAVIPLFLTGFGVDTMDQYHKTVKHIDKFKNNFKGDFLTLERDKFRKKLVGGYYCDVVGYNLAVKEAKLEKLVIKNFRLF